MKVRPRRRVVAGAVVGGQAGGRPEDAEGAGVQRRGHGGRPAVRHVGRGAHVRGVRQPGGPAPGPGGPGAHVPAPAGGQRPAAGVAAGAQLRLVDGRGAAGRVGGGPAERGHRGVLRGRGRGRARRFRPPAPVDGRGRGRRDDRRAVRAGVQRAVLRRLRGGRARAVHAQRGLLSAGRLFRGRARRRRPRGRPLDRTPRPPGPRGRRVRPVRRHGGRVRRAHRAQEPRLARRGVAVPVRHTGQPAQM